MYRYKHIIIEIEQGADGLFGLKVTDTETGAIWWETICETEAAAIEAAQSLFETEAMQDLQAQLNRVKVNK